MLKTVLLSALMAAGSVTAIPPVNWKPQAITASFSNNTNQAKITDYFKPVSPKTPNDSAESSPHDSQPIPSERPGAAPIPYHQRGSKFNLQTKVTASWPKDMLGNTPEHNCQYWPTVYHHNKICLDDLIVDCDSYKVVEDCRPSGYCSLSNKSGPSCSSNEDFYNKVVSDPNHPLNAGAGGKGGSENQLVKPPVADDPNPSPPVAVNDRKLDMATDHDQLDIKMGKLQSRSAASTRKNIDF